MSSDSVDERLTLEAVFRYGSCKLVIVPSFCKVLLSYVLTENGCLGELHSFL